MGGCARVATARQVPYENEIFVGEDHDTHGEYADEQLATVQKRICLIEFLHIRLIIVYQGTPTPTKNTNHPNGWFLFLEECGLWY